MSLPVLILRPDDSALHTAAKVRDLGLEPVVDPLFELESIHWALPDVSQFDSLLLTSANAVTFAGPALQQLSGLPVLAVGEKTAKAARKAGLAVADTGNGGAAELLAGLPGDRYVRILRLTGKDHVALDPSGRKIETRKVYQARSLPLGNDARQQLASGCAVLLFSARAGHILESEMQLAGISPDSSQLVALSNNIAAGLTLAWKGVHVAMQPTEDALLSLLPPLCSRP
ncbi:MAG: uroporphyrinogen-III synthase [Pseudomonadota bacterium]